MKPSLNNRPARMALVYIGDEQLAWARQAFAVPKHYYVMPAILYLAEVLKEHLTELHVDRVDCLHFNRAVHNMDEMVRLLDSIEPSLVGFSCYSWNLKDSLVLAETLKQKQPKVKVVLGGPEVSFSEVGESASFLENNPFIDAIVVGEGEEVICDLAKTLFGRGKLASLPNVVGRQGQIIVSGPRSDKPVNLERVPRIDPTRVDVPRTPGTGLAVVYQTYRGCPNACAYCSFHGGAKGIRRFPLERVQLDLAALFASKVALINFADAVFDINLDQAKNILRFCLQNNRSTSLLCYAAFQNVDRELAELLEQTKIQVGIGLQSIHEDVLKAVKRHFRVERFFNSLAVLSQRNINYYVDLMYGLPGDTPKKFRETFNRVILEQPPFVMPFPLTVIPRSELARDLSRFGLQRYARELIDAEVRPVSGMVYEDIGLSKNFNLDDLQSFDDVATTIFFAFQRYPMTLNAIVQYASVTRESGHGVDSYLVFEAIGRQIRRALDGRPVDITRPPRIEGELREEFDALLSSMHAGKETRSALQSLVRLESGIYHLLNRADRRTWWEKLHQKSSSLEQRKTKSNERTSVALAAPAWMYSSPYSLDDLRHLGTCKGIIEEHPTRMMVLAPYDDWRPRIFELSEMESTLCEQLLTGRSLSIERLSRQLKRNYPHFRGDQVWASLLERGVLVDYREQH